MGRPVKVLSERGRWLVREDGLRVLVTLHPSALLRGDPASRERDFEAWLADLEQATAAASSAEASPAPTKAAARSRSRSGPDGARSP